MTSWIPSAARRWLACAVTAVLGGCVLNAAKPYDGAASGLRGDRAIVVVGVTVKGAWSAPNFSVTLDHYDLAKQAITGGCFTYDRVEAVVPATPAPTRFFAFEVPPGPYVYSAFNATSFAARDQAFQASPGHVAYIGSFQLEDNRIVTLRRDLAADQAGIARDLPRLPAAVDLATAVTVVPARPFMCAP